MSEFLTVGEAAGVLHVDIQTIRSWLRNGTLRGVKLGKLWRVPAMELERLGAGPSTGPRFTAQEHRNIPVGGVTH